LGALGDRESVPALSLALTDFTPWVRRNAAWSLLELGEALQLVASMTQDADAGVRLFATIAQERLQRENGTDGSSPTL
jgi:HEAT repeat protein